MWQTIIGETWSKDDSGSLTRQTAVFGGLINKRAPSRDHLQSNVIILLISLHGNQISTGSFSVD